MQLRMCCDYVISSRTAAIRVLLQDVSSPTGQQQTINRVKVMASYCEKPVLIVERGRMGGGGGGKVEDGVTNRSKSLDHLCFLAFEAKHTKILYSDNMKQTAELIKKIAMAEGKKGKALPVVDKRKQSEGIVDRKFQFLYTLQGMPPAAAINYAVKFPNLRSILTASAAELAEKGVTPDARANRVTALFKKRVNDFAIND